MKKIKIKTRKSAAKRFKLSATGKVQFKRAGSNHFREHRSPSTKLGMRHSSVVHHADLSLVRRMLPGHTVSA